MFVNGCFRYGHKGCKYSLLPSTNLEYWEKKIADNLEWDERKTRELENYVSHTDCVAMSIKFETLKALYYNIVNC